jgi:photosystem II stability/assembly factor-like uncharacterized protein
MKKNNCWLVHQVTRRKAMVIYPLVLCLIVGLLPFSVGSVVIPRTGVSYSDESSSQKGGWERLESGVTQDLNSIFFICLNRGSVAGDEGVILHTGNGGDNWTAQNSGVTENLYGIFYYDYFITLAVGASGTILFTNNSGLNWTVVQTGMIGSYFSGQMISDTSGVAVGVNAIFQPFFTQTDDGWATWQSTSFYIEHESVLYEGWLSDVYFANETVGFATAVVDVPAGGAIVRTTDGGGSWETVYFSTQELFGIDFTQDGVGYAVGNHGVILQTLDGGVTWSSLDSGVTSVLRAVDFPTETSGTAVGDSGIILRTENAGASWTAQESGTTNNLLGARFITQRFGLVAGEHGTILRTTTGGYPEDTVPPETNCTLAGTLEGGVYISNVTVTLSATDDSSGVATTTYKLDAGQWITYNEPFVVTADGSHLLHFYSIDNAGNSELEKTREFTIQHPPDLTITLTGGVGIRVTIQNHDNSDLTNESWNLTLEGGIILFGKHVSGVTTVKAGSEEILRALVVGVGKATMTFSIAHSETTVQGRVFLFFVRI